MTFTYMQNNMQNGMLNNRTGCIFCILSILQYAKYAKYAKKYAKICKEICSIIASICKIIVQGRWGNEAPTFVQLLVRVILPQQKSRVYGNCMQF